MGDHLYTCEPKKQFMTQDFIWQAGACGGVQLYFKWMFMDRKLKSTAFQQQVDSELAWTEWSGYFVEAHNTDKLPYYN